MHRAVAVLVGPCVFAGSLYPQVDTVQIRMEYGMAGPELAQVSYACILV